MAPTQHLGGCNGACQDGVPRGVARGGQPRGAACSSAPSLPSADGTRAGMRDPQNAADSDGLTVVGRGPSPGPPAACVDVPGHDGIAVPNWLLGAPVEERCGEAGSRARARSAGAPGQHGSEKRCGVRSLTVAVEGRGDRVCSGIPLHSRVVQWPMPRWVSWRGGRAPPNGPPFSTASSEKATSALSRVGRRCNDAQHTASPRGRRVSLLQRAKRGNRAVSRFLGQERGGSPGDRAAGPDK